jgi:hypothetical protein
MGLGHLAAAIASRLAGPNCSVETILKVANMVMPDQIKHLERRNYQRTFIPHETVQAAPGLPA